MKTLTLIALLFISLCAHAQTTNYEDVVYLKNGSIIRGVIVEQVPNTSIKIETKDRSVFFFKIEEVEKLAKETIGSTKERTKPVPTPKEPKEKELFDASKIKRSGFTNITEMGTLAGISNNVKGAFFSLKSSFGAQLSPYFYAGGGIGIETAKGGTLNLFRGTKRDILLPVFAESRVFLLKKRVAPFIGQQAGYAVYRAVQEGASNNFKKLMGGLMLQTQVGFKTHITHATAFNFSVGYRVQKVNTPYQGFGEGCDACDPIFKDVKAAYHFVSVNLGFSF